MNAAPSRRTLLRVCGSGVLAGFAGCTGEQNKDGYLQAETRNDVPTDAEVVSYNSVNWENKEMVRQILREAYAAGTSSRSVQGNEYQEASEQLSSLESEYIEYKNITVVVYLATEQ